MRQIGADTVIDERYQVLEHLGSGGMAEVYCATDLQLGRKVALKILHERFASDDDFVERFKREASAAAGLTHQHLVAVYDRGEWNGTPYIAMEYVAGRTLKDVIRADGPLEPERAIELTIQILRAARFAHRREIVHRDFKPQNVIVDDEDRLKVTDFGIARAGASDMTETGSIMGTAHYLSPEQAQGHAVTGRSDLYSIGIVLYELLTGRVPFRADSEVTVALKQVREPPAPPRAVNDTIPPDLERVVLQALAKDPQDRFADADEFIAALQAAGSRIGAPAPALPLPPPVVPAPPASPRAAARPGPPRREAPSVPAPPLRARRRWPWYLLGALLGLAAILLVSSLASPERVPVPSVVGSSISVATQRLKDDGFAVEYVRDNSDKPRNTVIGQDPGGGASADEGSVVTLNISDGPAITEVPDVVDRGRQAARKLLVDAGFRVSEQREPSDEVRVNRVISQEPSGRSQAIQGTVVELTVSSGPERVSVPDVTGNGEEQARRTLEAAGLRVAVESQEEADRVPGTVLRQRPAAAATAPRGSTVTLTVAIEPLEIAVPDVVGRSQNSATATLSGRGFEVAVEEVEVQTPGQDGIVLRQSPGSRGGTVRRGSTVTITVGTFEPELNPDPGATTTTPPPTTTTPPP